MVAQTVLTKYDVTERTGPASSTAWSYPSQRVVTWTELTNAGFAAGDDVLVRTGFSLAGNSTTTNVIAGTFKKSSQPGDPPDAGDYWPSQDEGEFRTESDSTTAGEGHRPLQNMDRMTLVVNENFYFGFRALSQSSAREPRSGDWWFVIEKLDDLAAGDFRYAETGVDTTVSSAWEDGASVTLPADDDWEVHGVTKWDVGSSSESMLSRLSLAGGLQQACQYEGEDTNERITTQNLGLIKGPAANDVCKVQYRTTDGTAGAHDVRRSVIFAKRLNAYRDHAAERNTTSQNPASGTYGELESVTLNMAAAGDVIVHGHTIFSAGNASQQGKYRIQSAQSGIVAGMGNMLYAAYDANDRIPLGSIVSENMSSGNTVIDLDGQKSVNLPASWIDHTLIAHSVELAAAGPVTHQAEGSVTGTGETVGTANRIATVGASIAGNSGIEATLTFNPGLIEGAAPGVSSLQASAGVFKIAEGSVSGAGAMSGTLTTVTTSIQVDGSVSGAGAVSGDATYVQQASGDIIGLSSLLAFLIEKNIVSATLQGTSSLGGPVRGDIFVEGFPFGEGEVRGALEGGAEDADWYVGKLANRVLSMDQNVHLHKK